MSEPKDPPRLFEPSSGASDELRNLFEHAQRDVPTPAQLASLEAKLGPILDAPPPAPAAPAAPSLAKIGLGLLGGGALVAGVWLAMGRDAPPPSPVKPAATAATPAAPPAPSIPAEAAPSEPAASPSALAPPSAHAPAASPAQVTGTTAKRAPAIPEPELLERARGSLRSSPERALSLTRQHQLDFPNGVLAQEREVIAIEALRRLGRTEEAARRRERFERLYPQSAHQRKLDAPQREQ
jgi:hypothetical protein